MVAIQGICCPVIGESTLEVNPSITASGFKKKALLFKNLPD